MSTEIDREGNFQANITEYGVKEQESGAIAVAIKADITAMWNGEDWEDWSSYGMVASGDIYIVKKDGTLNQNAVQSLKQHAGWDCSIGGLVDGTWQPTPCQIVVKADTYKDNVRYRIAFVNDLNRAPGQMSNIDADKAKALQARFGSELRALGGNANRNAEKPAGKPSSPPIEKRPINRQAMANASAGQGDDGIPF